MYMKFTNEQWCIVYQTVRMWKDTIIVFSIPLGSFVS